MELREPPRPPARRPTDPFVRTLLVVNLALVAALGGWLVLRRQGAADLEVTRAVAAKLQAAGAVDEAAALYARYLEAATAPVEARAAIAYSVGSAYLDAGQPAKALRWLYWSETLGAGELGDELGRKVVRALERLGSVHAAQAALAGRVQLGDQPAAGAADDPVVARIGADELHRSDLHRALDMLPPAVARSVSSPSQREALLRQLVAQELLWRKAVKLEYDRDPEVARQLEEARKQLAVAAFVQREVLGKVTVADADLETFYTAHRERYGEPEAVQLSLIQLPDRAAADAAAREIAGGAGFAAVARRRSLDAATRERGGRLERWVQRGEPFLGEGDAEAVAAAVFAAAKGEVTPPVAAGGHVYLFRIEDQRPARPRPLAEVRQAVERDYRAMKAQSAYDELLAEAMATEEVKLFPEALGDGAGKEGPR